MDLQYVLVVLATVLAGISYVDAEEMSNAKKVYCGRNLSRTLSTVCKGNYNTLNKKSGIRQYDPYASDSQQTIDFPFRSKASASSLITNFRRRRRRGVFNECCQKPCSHEELTSYCATSKR